MKQGLTMFYSYRLWAREGIVREGAHVAGTRVPLSLIKPVRR